MAETAVSPLRRFIRGIGIRQVRLITGLVLFAYVISHFANHALGNVSLGAMDDGLYYHAVFWKSWPMTIVLYGSVLTHLGLGIWALYARRHFRWTGMELTQLVLGLSIPVFIISHVIGVRLAASLLGHEKDYPQVFFAYWVYRPEMQWSMYAVLLVSWVHGCIGIYFWLRTKPYFRKISSLLLALAVILPTLSMLGLYQGGRAVQFASTAPEWRAENLSRDKVGTGAEQAALEQISSFTLYGYFGLMGLALVARGVRALMERRRGLVKLSYGNGKTVRVPVGLSVLEASTRFNIPHSSVCGGRARCSTCRIRVIGDCSALPNHRTAKPSCSKGSAPAAIPPFASPASYAPGPMSRSSRSFPRIRLPRRRQPSSRRFPAGSVTSSACSWTCADRPSSPSSFCRSIPFSSSTAS